MTFSIACPHCKAIIEWSSNNPFRPFCSERCKMIDFGQWDNEAYAIAVGDEDEDEFEEDITY